MIALPHDEDMGKAVIGLLAQGNRQSHFAGMKARILKKTAAKKAAPRRPRAKAATPAVKPLVTPAQLPLLRDSFARVNRQAHAAALEFYRNLFNLDPSLRPLFHTNIEVQGRKLMEALEFTLATLENPKKLLPELAAMGRRHVTYGVRDEHYDTVVKALMLTLRQTLGPAFTPAVRAAWSAALNLVTDTMKRGAAPVVALKKSVKK